MQTRVSLRNSSVPQAATQEVFKELTYLDAPQEVHIVALVQVRQFKIIEHLAHFVVAIYSSV